LIGVKLNVQDVWLVDYSSVVLLLFPSQDYMAVNLTPDEASEILYEYKQM
jgi:hypothetical protein